MEIKIQYTKGETFSFPTEEKGKCAFCGDDSGGDMFKCGAELTFERGWKMDVRAGLLCARCSTAFPRHD